MKKDHFALLLAGGQGSRFWPQSRTLEPKQFLRLHQNTSLFEQTISRLDKLVVPNNIFIVTSGLYIDHIRESAEKLDIPVDNIIIEPSSKNTAPSIALAAARIAGNNPDARLAILPCDHMIRNVKSFKSVMNFALNHCDSSLIVFGVPPHRPATGYGYIKAALAGNNGILQVEKFCEKPGLDTAIRFVKSGRYFWNSGMFVGGVQKFLEEFKRHLPQHYDCVSEKCADKFKKKWSKIPAISFDYGIMERAKNVLMIRADGLGWSDLGSWQAWDELVKKDAEGNAFLADVVNIDSEDTTILGGSHLIAALGVKDLMVVDTPDALLIAKKDKSEEVNKIVDILKSRKRQEHYSHRTVRRPWGSYTVLDTGTGFKIKLVEVKPHKSLSLQLHKERSEHWIVVEGLAKIVRGKKAYFVGVNESTFIPIGCVHRLINPKDTPLTIVEVQSGNYLEEDDIVRFKDDFGRKLA